MLELRPLQGLQLVTRNVTRVQPVPSISEGSKAKGNTGIKRIIINFSSVLPAFACPVPNGSDIIHVSGQVSHCGLKKDEISFFFINPRMLEFTFFL